jgi:predicted nucleic acid-binding protein
MRDKAFLDTNIIIYGYSCTEPIKKERVLNIFNSVNCIISTQVIQEFSNILHKKFSLDWNRILKAIAEISGSSFVVLNNMNTITHACKIADKYQYSFYDSLIISAALEVNCKILYSEDLQHGQLIENKIQIINPFN